MHLSNSCNKILNNTNKNLNIISTKHKYKMAKKEKVIDDKDPTWNQIGQAIGTKIDKGCDDEDKDECNCIKDKKCSHDTSCGGFLYGLGFIGALIYYISTSSGFWMGVLGLLKAVVWPAFLVHGLLKFLGM